MKGNNLLSVISCILIYIVIFLAITQSIELSFFVLALLPPFVFALSAYLNHLFWRRFKSSGYFEYLPVGVGVWILTALILLL